MSYYFAEIFYTLTESLVLFVFLAKVHGVIKINYIKAASVVILHTVFITLLNLFWGTFSAGVVYYPVIIIITAVLYNYIIRESIITVLIFTLLGFALSMLCDLAMVSTILAVIDQEPSAVFASGIYRTMGALLSRTLFFIVAIMILSRYFRKIKDIFPKINRIYNFSVIFVIGIISFLILAANNFYMYTNIFKGHVKWYITIVAIGIIVFSAIIIGILTRTFALMQKDIEWRYKESVMEQQRLYLENIDEIIRNLRAQRHDFKHHIGCLYGLLERKEYEAAKAYIEELTEEIVRYDQLVNIENPVLASILNVKLLKAMEEDIMIDTHIHVPKEIGFENINMARIIGNIMDNAIEACMRTSDKYIRIYLHMKSNNLIIKVINSKPAEIRGKIREDGTYFTTKTKDPESHGFGIRNVSKIVKKHGGIFKASEREKEFEVRIAIPLGIAAR